MSVSSLQIVNSKGQPLALPNFGGALVSDTHAHLDMLDDPALALARAAVAGVGFIVTLVNVLEEPERTFSQLNQWIAKARVMLDEQGYSSVETPEVKIIIGIHPHDASQYDEAAAALIRDYARDERVVGLGEVGLDYFYDHSPREIQREAFAQQLRLAKELGLPICIHLRDAHDEGLAILKSEGLPPQGAVLHCFNLSYEVAKPFMELGCRLSFAGPLTFKKATEVRQAAAMMSQNGVFPETDSPFMAPEPLRGKRNEPAYVVFTAAVLADCLGLSLSECANITTQNARLFFRRG